MKIRFIALSSPLTVAEEILSSASYVNVMFFASACGESIVKTSLMLFSKLKVFSSICHLPASIFDQSRISLMTVDKCSPLFLMSVKYSLCRSDFKSPPTPPSMASEKPIIAFNGVLISWLILARNADLA